MITGPCAALLERAGGDQQICVELCNVFLEDAPKRLALIRQALTAGDAAALRRAAHGFKGAASVFDAAVVVAAARRLEDAAVAGNLAGAPEIFKHLEEHSAALIEAVRAGRDGWLCKF